MVILPMQGTNRGSDVYRRVIFRHFTSPSPGVVETFSAHLRLIKEIKRKNSSATVFSSKVHLTVGAAFQELERSSLGDGPQKKKKHTVCVIHNVKTKK